MGEGKHPEIECQERRFKKKAVARVQGIFYARL
jgi:hypothetical protein